MSILKQWDRILIYLLLMAFGGYSTVYPIVSFERVAPYWAELALGIEFFIAGGFLMVGMGPRKGYRMAGLLVVACGLTTISILVGLVGGMRVLSYAFLFGAFAMQSIYDIRRENRERKKHKTETEQLAVELFRLANTTRQGES